MYNQSSGLFKRPGNIFAPAYAVSETKVAWSDVKLLVYMTTHLPEGHIAFLPCWKDAIQRLDIFKHADGMIYTPIEPTKEQLDQLPFQSTTIKKVPSNVGYQEGAIQAMVDPFVDEVSWFDGYDWVIRLNPDVLIRNDTWLIQTMLNTTIDVILHDCATTDHPHFHTDFYAFRPNAVDRERLLQAERLNAETHITNIFIHLYRQNRFAHVPGAKNMVEGYCRIAGVHSPVVHVHGLSDVCPYYYNATETEFDWY